MSTPTMPPHIAAVSRERTRALSRLGVTEEQIRSVAQITPQIRMIAHTIRGKSRAPYGPGGDINVAWPSYLNASDMPEARKVLDVYHSLESCHRSLPIEAFCVAAGVSTLTVLEILTAIIVRQGVQASQIIAAVNHPRVVEKTVEMALTDRGIEDRVILHKHAGFLPTPKGPSTSVVVTQNASATAQAASVAAPPPEQTIRRLADRFNLARTLPESASTTPMPAAPAPVEAEYVEADDVREE